MPSTSGGIWYTTAQKTYDQVWEDWDETCGGGIYWVRGFSRNLESVVLIYLTPRVGTEVALLVATRARSPTSSSSPKALRTTSR